MENQGKENLIVNLTLNFAIEIVKYCELLEEKKKFVIAKQLLKSGTSIGAMLEKHKMQKAKLTLFINLKLLRKK
jgi:four helix bundle protein